VIGADAAAYLTRFIAKLLYNVAPFDALTIAIVVGTLAATAIVASVLPARRATRADPMLALRSD